MADGGSTDHRTHTTGLYTITFHPLGDTVVCRADETVLSAILRSGAKIVFGCRGGGCGTCKMRLTSGHVDYGRCSVAVLSEDDKRGGSFLSCQARPLSDLTVGLTATNSYRRLDFCSLWTAERSTKFYDFPHEPQKHPRGWGREEFKTAKALGLTIPQSLLLRAAQVIE